MLLEPAFSAFCDLLLLTRHPINCRLAYLQLLITLFVIGAKRSAERMRDSVQNTRLSHPIPCLFSHAETEQ
jgi:hypothetical protein